MDRPEHGKRVVVIGGGITGLTAAYRLTQAAQAHEEPLEVILLEASGRLGGTIATHSQDGLLMEQGPDCFLSAKPWGVRLCEELGLGDRDHQYHHPIPPEFYCAWWQTGPGTAGVLSHGSRVVAVAHHHAGV